MSKFKDMNNSIGFHEASAQKSTFHVINNDRHWTAVVVFNPQNREDSEAPQPFIIYYDFLNDKEEDANWLAYVSNVKKYVNFSISFDCFHQ